MRNLLPAIALVLAITFTACEETNLGSKAQDSTTIATTKKTDKHAEYLSKMKSEEDKTTLKAVLTMLDSKNLNICQVDKELLVISTQSRREGEAKFGVNKPETLKYAGKLEKERKEAYWKEKGLPDTLSSYIAVFTLSLDCN